jgi:hypothetical protein
MEKEGAGRGKMKFWSRWYARRKVMYIFVYRMMGKWREGIWEQNKGRIIESRRDKRIRGPL